MQTVSQCHQKNRHMEAAPATDHSLEAIQVSWRMARQNHHHGGLPNRESELGLVCGE